ncbi:MAG: extracellular solute-binding protein [Acetivibrio sp.]
MKKKLRYIILVPILLLALLMAYSGKDTSIFRQDIFTQKVIPPEKTPITILVKYAFGIHTFEKVLEERFPSIDIVQIGNYTSNRGIAEYEARMEHDDLADIVMTWPLEIGKEYWEDRLLDLSAMSLTGKYSTASLNNISHDGKLYYLPGPSQIRGIVYNKTLFEEKGWNVPKDFEGFIALCRRIEADGIRSLQLGLGNPEVLDTAFVGYSYGGCYSTPQDTQWINEYNTGKGSFGDHFRPALETFQTLVTSGILKPEDLEVTYAKRERMLFQRQCAMVEDSVLLARMGDSITGTTDEFALMPFFNPGLNGDWARLYPVCYIGLNKHLGEPKNKEKYDLVRKIMEYISTPDGQLALAGDTGAMYSSLNSMPPPDVSEILPLLPTLNHGRYAIFPTLKNAQNALRSGLSGMVRGDFTIEDVIKMVDKENLSPPVPMVPLVLGTAKADFSILETGNFITDAMVAESGCEIALFLDNGKDGFYNGKGICSKIYKGDITTVDLQRLMPDTKNGERSELQKITISGADLLRTLEYSIPVDNNNGGWFYYFSGLRMKYDPCASPGSRIHKISDAQGSAIDPERIYSVAIMDGSVSKEYFKTVEDTHIKISDLLSDTIQSAKVISPSNDRRFIFCAP